MTFSGQAGNIRSQAGNMVAGYGSSVVRNSKGLSGSMRPTGRVTTTHTFVFSRVSMVLFRAVSRATHYITNFRSRPS